MKKTIIGLLVLIVILFVVIQVSAHEKDGNCNQDYCLPVIPSFIPSCTPTPTAICLMQGDQDVQTSCTPTPTIENTPTAGASATPGPTITPKNDPTQTPTQSPTNTPTATPQNPVLPPSTGRAE